MALSYATQVVYTVFNAAVLTATLADTLKKFTTEGASKVELVGTYTMGAAETSNTLNLVTLSSPDNVTYGQLQNDSTSGGTSTLAARSFSISPGSFSLPLDISNIWTQIQVSESGVASNFGTLTLYATVSGR